MLAADFSDERHVVVLVVHAELLWRGAWLAVSKDQNCVGHGEKECRMLKVAAGDSSEKRSRFQILQGLVGEGFKFLAADSSGRRLTRGKDWSDCQVTD